MNAFDNTNNEDVAPNTDLQNAIHERAEAAWAEEQTWPIYQVFLVGDPTVWVPRFDPSNRYWHQEDPDDPNSDWVPNAAEDLPEDAHLNEFGDVVRIATADVKMHARSEDHAKMLAMRDNPEYHTIDRVVQLT